MERLEMPQNIGAKMSSADRDTQQARERSESGFPPESTRAAEIEAIVEFFSGILQPKSAVYVSAPITSGRRFVDWLTNFRQQDVVATEEQYRREHAERVIRANREGIRALVANVRKRYGAQVIDPTTVGELSSWTQNDYRAAWAKIIEAFAHTVLFADGWYFSNGCTYEYLVAARHSIQTVDENGAPIPLSQAISMIGNAIEELTALDAPGEFLRGILEELESLRIGVNAAFWDLSEVDRTFKDSVLNELSRHGNVAQFVSFGPDLGQRFSRIVGYSANTRFETVEASISALIKQAPEQSVNIRTYHPEEPKSREFVYGIRTVSEVVNRLRAFAEQKLYTIVNETVDVNDGGVSGVCLGHVIEFAPQDTPRCVEKPGTASLPKEIGLAIFQRVYGFTPNIPVGRWRVEFSLHPLARGYRHEHTILWEAEPEVGQTLPPAVAWPNRFSRFIGDKAYGLLVADAFGWRVPETTVVARTVAPFVFGRPTGSGEVWIRTCPAEPVPGQYTTRRGWTDPFRLLQAEDPGGEVLQSVLSQDGVYGEYSGALIGSINGEPVIEGVRGEGSQFMLGARMAEVLPTAVVESVGDLFRRVAETLSSAVKIEWAFDGTETWILQLQLADVATSRSIIVPGKATRFYRFDVDRGLNELRSVIASLQGSGDGIELIGGVGITSHFGDLLRRARIPARLGIGV
jgi:hypothetical protein